MRLLSLVIAFSIVGSSSLNAACHIDDERKFSGDGERVRLSRSDRVPKSGSFAVYKAPLAVNTDGAPNSYNPYDFRGREKAINRLDNGITIRSLQDRRLSVEEKVTIFNQWRDGDWVVPNGYRITWKNVIAATSGGKPCVFSAGPHKGYFGSLTALKNGLPSDKAGECAFNDQLDQRFIPAIVLRGENNPLSSFGARTGDLVLATNPETGATVSAIVGDIGDGDRIGEGSVALNMALLGTTRQPTTYQEALGLDTGRREMVVAVLPATRGFKRVRPYSPENIRQRVEEWAAANGYGGLSELKTSVLSCAQGL